MDREEETADVPAVVVLQTKRTWSLGNLVLSAPLLLESPLRAMGAPVKKYSFQRDNTNATLTCNVSFSGLCPINPSFLTVHKPPLPQD